MQEEKLLAAAFHLPNQSPLIPSAKVKNIIQRLTRLHTKIFGWNSILLEPEKSTDDYLAITPKEGADIFTVGKAAVVMARMAKMPVILQYEGVPVYATNKTKSRAAFYQLWEQQSHLYAQKNEESFSYLKALNEKTLRHQKARKELRGERLKLVSESVWHVARNNASKELLAIMEYAERLGCFLQIQLRQNPNALTPVQVALAEKSVDFQNESPRQKMVAYDLLCEHWLYGHQLAQSNPEKHLSGKALAFIWMQRHNNRYR